MTQPPPENAQLPGVVLVSDRGVVDDDRLRNHAATLAAAGAHVTVLGISPSATRTVTVDGATRLLEIPVRYDLRDSLAGLRRARSTAPAPAARERWSWQNVRDGLILARVLRRTWDRTVATTSARLALAGRPEPMTSPLIGSAARALVVLLGATVAAGRLLDHAGVRVLRWYGRQPSQWRARLRRRPPSLLRAWPEIADLELTLGPVLDGLTADVICAHGFRVVPLVEAAAVRWRARGRRVEWIYDAREDVRTLDGISAHHRGAADRLERKHLHGARAVLAATDRIAAAIPWAGQPVVIGDAPSLRTPRSRPRSDLRRTAGLLDDVPLLVVAAPVASGQGFDVLVRALPLLPGVHCALFAPREKSGTLRELRDIARRLHCLDRLHVVPPISGRDAPAFLASASAGVHLGAEPAPGAVALPFAYLAYVHAGLPIAFMQNDDPEALAVAVRTALAHGHAQPEELQRFAWESEEREGALLALYRGVLGDRLEPAADGPEAVTEVAHHDPPAPIPARARVKLFAIGPRNGNGQPWEWSRALTAAYPSITTEVFGVQYVTGRLDMAFPCHRSIPLRDWKSLDWQLSWAKHLITDVSHLLIEQGLSVCGRLNGRNFFHDLPMLLGHGVTVGLVFRGSEIRNPALHAAREPYSPFADPADSLTARLQRQVDELRPHVDAFEGEVYVTTLDLKDDLPDATWLPHVIDVDLWAGGGALLQRRVPVVLHAPSREAMKGSALIDAVCEPLAEAGRIDYRRIRSIPYERMPGTLRDADIVIDQFALGAYGVLASQALAAGRLVIGHVSDRVRSRLPVELPIVEAEPDTLADVLLSLVDDPDGTNEAASRGEAYVRRFHSGAYSAGQLAGLLRFEELYAGSRA